MKVSKIVFALFLVATIAISCKTEPKTEVKKEIDATALAKAETLSLNVTGMTCEMGCANTIESKLAKKEGVFEAKVIFNDSLATIKYDGNKLNKEELITFIEGVGDGESYKAIEVSKAHCEPGAKKDCCTTEKDGKKACKEGDANKECCKTEKA